MNKILLVFAAFLSIALSACTKNDIPTYSGNQVEWDAASWNANTSPNTYPILTRVPVQGAATPTSAPLLTRTSGTVRLRVNLIGAQSSTERTFRYQFTPTGSTAVPGTHFQAVSGTGTIPANSSFGFVDINILNPGVGTGQAIAVFELITGGELEPTPNYSKVGLSIRQS